MFKITKEWLEANSNNGGYSAKQLKAVNVSWPPQSGWKKRLIGCIITEVAKVNFETGGKHKPKTEAQKEIHKTELGIVRDAFAAALIYRVREAEMNRQSYSKTDVEKDAISKFADEIVDIIENGFGI